MKKKVSILFGVILALVFAFALTACGKVSLKLTFKVDGVDYATISTSGDEVIKMPENPTKDGFVFDGWFWDEGTWQKPFTANSLLDTPLSSDMSVYAKFTANADAPPTGTEIRSNLFTQNGEVYSTVVPNRDSAFSFNDKIQVADGATWALYDNIRCVNEIISRATEIEAGDNIFYVLVINGSARRQYTFNVRRRPIYTVNFKSDGPHIASQQVEEGNLATEPVGVTREGYEFDSWSYDFSQPIMSYTEIGVRWKAIDYDISYSLDGGEFKTDYAGKYTIENEIKLATPEKRGYDFAGWYETGKTAPTAKIAKGTFGNKTFTAKWNAHAYDINYVLGGGTNSSNNPTKYTIESDDITLSEPTKTGYTFAGWAENGAIVTEIRKGSVGNRTFTATWVKTPYYIDYILNGGTNSPDNPTEYTIESGDITLSDPTKSGYTFTGWTENGVTVTEIKSGSIGHRILTATWSVIEYDINFVLGGGTNSPNNPTKYTIESDDITLSEPTRTGYTFAGWAENGVIVTEIKSGSIGHRAFTAQWETIEYSITYNLDGGEFSATPTLKYTIETPTFSLATPTRKGYTFDGWYSGSNKITYVYKGSTGNKIFQAKWQVINYKINYNLNGGVNSPSNPSNYTVEQSVVLSDPSRDGYTFAGWNEGNTIEKGSTGTKTFTAKWSVITYNINYDLDEGSFVGSYQQSYTIESYTITLPTPQKKGYTFLGWYDGETKVTYIFKGSFGEKSFKAKWELDVYKINYIVNYGVNNEKNNVLTYTVYDEVEFFDPYYINGDFIEWRDGNGNKITKISRGSVGDVSVRAVYDLYDVKLSENSDGTYTVVGKQTNDDTVIIKSEYKNKRVTSIGNNAFSGCYSLTSITIPDSVKKIGNYAFDDRNSLTSVHISDIAAWCGIDFGGYYSNPLCCARNLYLNNELVTELVIPTDITEIEDYAFSGYSSLTSISIPDSVTIIGEYAFYNCSSLTSATIGNSVTSIGSGAFSGCSSLTSATIGNSVTSIGSSTFRDCSNLTSVEIPDSVTSIGDYAFSGCSSLTSVEIPNSVTIIGDYAFEGCSALTSITIPDGVTSIGRYTFSDCSALMDVSIPNSVTSIGDNAFYNCTGLTSVTIGDNATGIDNFTFSDCPIEKATIPTSVISSIPKSELVTVIITSGESIESSAFYNCSNLNSVTIGDNVMSIENSAFWNCSSLTSVTIGNSVESIGSGAFLDCIRIISISVSENNSSYKSIDDNLYSKDGKTLILYAIGKKETQFIIPDSVTSIGYRAFSGCSDLTSIAIPNSVTSIGSSAFSGCSDLTSISIPNSVISIGSSAFYNCSSLTSIKIGNSVTSIGYDAFYGCIRITSITVDENNNNYKSIDGNLYSKDGKTLILYAKGKTETHFTIPDSVTRIKDRMFYNCSGLTSITMGNAVTSIGEYAFYNCSGLTSITMSNALTSIGEYVFYNCSGLTSITMGNAVTSIGEYAFYNCSGLTSITMPDSVTSIGGHAFENCSGLTGVTIGKGVTSIGSSAFENCSGLKSVTIIGYGNISVGKYAFFGCSSLTSVYYNGLPIYWSLINISDGNNCLTSATRYYYSENRRVDGNYWHYVDGVPTVWK